ncbi:MAG: hypothetical protein JXR88_07065 [Clostridia bacterium]|nr:hypothetical protein [Clostridia bacterium]
MKAFKELAKNFIALALFVVLCLFIDQMTPDKDVHAYRSAQFYGLKDFNLEQNSSYEADQNKFWGIPSL